MDFASFKGNILALKIDSKTNKGNHSYLIEEDLIAYYCARTSLSKKDTLDVLVLKMNRLLKSDLKLSSFTMRISNMNFNIYGKGNKNNSEQGKGLASFLNKLFVNKKLDNNTLKNYINEIMGEVIL